MSFFTKTNLLAQVAAFPARFETNVLRKLQRDAGQRTYAAVETIEADRDTPQIAVNNH